MKQILRLKLDDHLVVFAGVCELPARLLSLGSHRGRLSHDQAQHDGHAGAHHPQARKTRLISFGFEKISVKKQIRFNF